MSAPALKEWASLCELLLQGKMIGILRKGGLADSPGVFDHASKGFWIHPTHFHEQRSSLREGWSVPAATWEREAQANPGMVPIPAFCKLTGSYQINRLETALAWSRISPYTEEIVHTRFNYRQPGIQLHTLRVYPVHPVLWVRDQSEWAGCKSFHSMDLDTSNIPIHPVFNDDDYRREVLRIEEILRPTAYA